MDAIQSFWDEKVLPALMEYIKIPAVSQMFDPDWAQHGHIQKAVEFVRSWCSSFVPPFGATVDVVQLDERAPVLFIDVPGEPKGKTTLFYGHLDKQPPMLPWADGLDPWKPVSQQAPDGSTRLYGRGSADDGYAVFAAMTAIVNLRQHGYQTGRCVLLIETAEESGSPDLPAYLDLLKNRIGTPGLIIALDSGCGTYDRLWLTNSLRGIVVGTLRVDVLTQGVHSGDAGGIVPSSFFIAYDVLRRLVYRDGTLRPHALFNTTFPESVIERTTKAAARAIGRVSDHFPWASKALHKDRRHVAPADQVWARTWEPAVEVTAAEGLPPIRGPGAGGNVLRPFTEFKLVIRTPPSVDVHAAYKEVKQLLEKDPPFDARVHFEGEGHPGWIAPSLAPWLEASLQHSSKDVFGKPMVQMGEGGAIPFMRMLGQRFPQAQFVITGVLGPGSNAHGPNEFLHVDYAMGLTACIANTLSDFVQSQ